MTHDETPWAPVLRVAALSGRKAVPVEIAPDAPARARLAAELGLRDLPALRFAGTLKPEGRADWRLSGRLAGRAVQDCVVTLAPVETAVDTDVTRRFLADWSEPEAGETEIPEDTDTEPLGAAIDLGAVLAEALALALPEFPRAPGAELGEAVYAPPGTAPLRDADLKPLAGLAALRDRLSEE